ncbi:MAG: hypothetical protein Q9163_002365 [Psora crenata]
MSTDAERPPLTAAEIYQHPEFHNVYWDLTPAIRGTAIVAKGRKGGPLKLAYEVHGEGPTKIVWIIGLAGFMSAWQRQTKDFGHGQNTNRGQSLKYSVLVFDNRGMGQSEKPLTRYSTSEMAVDTLELFDHIGWSSNRQLHVVGSSCSVPKAIDIQLSETKQRAFSSAWLKEPDAEGQFPTNGDRFAAQELMKRKDVNNYTRKGFIMQAIAAGWHHKSVQQLTELGDKVGRERIQVIHGTADQMITYPHGEVLAKELGGEARGVTFIRVEGKGHGLQMEWRRDLTKVIAALIEKTEKMPAG